MALRGDTFSAEQKCRNFAYYEALTVRDSSLAAGRRKEASRCSARQRGSAIGDCLRCAHRGCLLTIAVVRWPTALPRNWDSRRRGNS